MKLNTERFQLYVPPTEEAEQIKKTLDQKISELSSTDQPFLSRFAESGMDEEELRRFSPQWFKAIYAHKQALGMLVGTTPDELLRGDILTILYDEFGDGKPANMHTRMFLRVPEEIGMALEDIQSTPTIPEIERFGEYVDRTWSNKESPAKSYGVLYLFESIGADFHTKFLQGLEKSGLSDRALAYSKLHTTAEEEHAQIVVNGLGVYQNSVEDLVEGVVEGSDQLDKMWAGFDRHVYGK